MVIVYGATKQHPTDEWIELAKGIPDAYGNPFTLIKLNWNSSRANTPNSKSHGFEDAIIRKERGVPTITYREPGCAQWQKSPLGLYFSYVPKTRHNLIVLAHHFYDGLWEIDDEVIRAEVEVLAKKIEEGLSTEWKEFNDRRREDMHRNRFETVSEQRAPVPIHSEDSKLNLNLTQKSMDLHKKEQELARREKLLREKEKAIAAKSNELNTHYSREALEVMEFQKLKKVARDEYGIELDPKATKVIVIDSILEATGNKTEPEKVTA